MSAPESPRHEDDEHIPQSETIDLESTNGHDAAADIEDPEVVAATAAALAAAASVKPTASSLTVDAARVSQSPADSPVASPTSSNSSTSSGSATRPANVNGYVSSSAKKAMDLSGLGSGPITSPTNASSGGITKSSSFLSFGKRDKSPTSPRGSAVYNTKPPLPVTAMSAPLSTQSPAVTNTSTSTVAATHSSRFSFGSLFRSLSELASPMTSSANTSAHTSPNIREQQHEQHKKDWQAILASGSSFTEPKTKAKCVKLTWHGIPSSIRGEAWKFVIGNQLNITEDLFWIMMGRAQEVKELKLLKEKQRAEENGDIDSGSSTSPNKEASVALIDVDVSRTFQELKFFHDGGPLQAPLFQILEAYGCYRPDVGYIQGMSYLAAMLLLNLDTLDAFIALCNLLNQDMYFKFFRMNAVQMRVHLRAFQVIFSEQLPVLYQHFDGLGIQPDMYLYEWLLTIFSRSLALDATHRIWDNFLCQGHVFLFRTALGLLRMQQAAFIESSFEECLEKLQKPPKEFDVESFFNDHVAKITLTEDKLNKVIAEEAKAG